MKCFTRNIEVNYPCSPACPLYGDCVVVFRGEKKKQIRTNAERIRAMSDEELAWELMTWRVDAVAMAYGDENVYPDTQEKILSWLQQPAEEGD